MTHVVTTEHVTPEMARRWLDPEINKTNRKLKPVIVRKYIADMGEAHWIFNGDSLKFDWNGKLLDGQHRLHAVIAMGHPVEFLIVRNLHPDAYLTIDIGARRTMGDMMQRIGSKQSSAAGAAAKVLYWFDTGQTLDFNATYSTAQLLASYKEHPKLEEFVAQYTASSVRWKLRAGSAWPVVAYIASRRYPVEWAAFQQSVAEGSGIAKGDPRYTLREWLLNRTASKRQARNDERFNVFAKAWNAHIRGRKLFVLVHRSNEAPVVPAGA